MPELWRKMHAGIVAALALAVSLVSCPLFALFSGGRVVPAEWLWCLFVLFLPLHSFTLFLSASRFLQKKSAASA